MSGNLVLVTPGFAQEVPDPQADTSKTGTSSDTSEAGTIIVTARKQAETILDVPVAITAFGEEQIEALGLSDIRDLPDFTPGFKYEAFSGFPGRIDSSPRFRGISVNSTDPTRQTASVFVDGVFVAGGVQGIQFSEVERIEIIKGPQSAYFGRNTFGGAINYITKTPGKELAGNLSGYLSHNGSYEISGGVETPLAGDVLSVRIGGAYHDQRGFFKNKVDGGEIGREKTWSIGGVVYIKPSAHFDAKLRVHYFENDDGPPAYGFNGVAEHNCGPFTGGLRTLICGDVRINQPALNTRSPDALFAAQERLPALNGKHRRTVGLDRQTVRVSGQFEYRIPGTSIAIDSITAYNYEEANFVRDIDEQAANVFFAYAGRQFQDYSQELRVSGSSLGDRLKWSVGGNYFDQRYTNNGASGLVATNRFLGTGAPQETNIKTAGLFGGLDFSITEALSVAVEGRYQTDRISEDINILDAIPGLKDTFKNVLPRVIVSYKPGPDILVYTSYAEGNLPGGFNAEVIELNSSQLSKLLAIDPTVRPSFSEEKLESWELGAKSGIDQNRGFVSATLYYMKRSDQSFRRISFIADPTAPNGLDQVTYFANAGLSRSIGLELEASYRVSPVVTLAGTLGYNDGKFLEFESGIYNEVFGTTDASGQALERYPKWSGSLSAIFRGEASATVDWFGRVDGIYTGRRFADETNLASAAPGVRANLRAGLETDAWRFEAFVENVTNDDSPTALNRTRDTVKSFTTFGYQHGLRRPREFGVRAGFKF
jgi:iron complex outermembrane receptor protein